MDVTHQADDEQTTLWNDLAGSAWVEAQELLKSAVPAACWMASARAPSASAAPKEVASA